MVKESATKADLAEEYDESLREVENTAAGIDIFAVSAVTGYGLEALSKYLIRGKTVVLLGSSGVGKSSLVNALAGEDLMSVSAIREDDSKGRHTTTHRQLIMLKNGIMVIDTPGMRELGMWDIRTGLGEAFADVEEILSHPCRFHDCKHETEPGCSVKAAIEKEVLSIERWRSYQGLQRESKYNDDYRAAIHEKQQRQKKIAKRKRDRY